MNKMYLVNGRVSETPAYWTAHYNNEIINQIDLEGHICNKWSILPLQGLEYWGIISNIGCYGFYPLQQICDLNGVKCDVNIQKDAKILYRRTLLSSLNGWSQTKCVEIKLDNYQIKIFFYPEYKIVFSRPQEIQVDI